MEITNISSSSRRDNRYNVFVNHKFSFSLSGDQLLETKLVVGEQVDKARLGVLKKQASENKLYALSLRYASMRRRSLWEVETYLTRKGSPTLLTQSILNKLSKVGLIDDEVFARAWIENRHLLRPTSRRRLVQELKQKRISQAIIDKILSEAVADSVDLQKLIKQKQTQPKYADRLKLMQYLARQGFNYDDIKSALSEIDQA